MIGLFAAGADRSTEGLPDFLTDTSIPITLAYLAFFYGFIGGIASIPWAKRKSRLLPIIVPGAFLVVYSWFGMWNTWEYFDLTDRAIALATIAISLFLGVLLVVHNFKRAILEGPPKDEDPNEVRYLSHLGMFVFKKILSEDERAGLNPISDNRKLGDPGVGTSGTGTLLALFAPLFLSGFAYLAEQPVSWFELLCTYIAQSLVIFVFTFGSMFAMKIFTNPHIRFFAFLTTASLFAWAIVSSLAPGTYFEVWPLWLLGSAFFGIAWGISNAVRLRWLNESRNEHKKLDQT